MNKYSIKQYVDNLKCAGISEEDIPLEEAKGLGKGYLAYKVLSTVPNVAAQMAIMRDNRNISPEDLKRFEKVKEEAEKFLGKGSVQSTFDKDLAGNAFFTGNRSEDSLIGKYMAKKGITPRKILLGKGMGANPNVLSHELGHAYNMLGGDKSLKSKLGRLLARSGSNAAVAGVGAVTPLAGIGAAYLSEDDELTSNLLKGTSAASAALSVPRLLEEARASIKAHNIMKKYDPSRSVSTSLRKLGPAYSTYLLKALSTTAFPLFLDYYDVLEQGNE